jgi:hypothetical protein
VDEWSALPVKGIIFDFYTPMRGSNDGFWLPPPERDQVVERLLALKEQVGDFLKPPAEVYESMLSERAGRVTENCLYSAMSLSFDSSGVLKEPCIMGPEADCSRCGCVVPFFIAAVQDKAVLRALLWRNIKEKLASNLQRIIFG